MIKYDDLRALDQAKELIEKAMGSKFYGKLTFQFQNGKIVIIRKEETLAVENNS